MWSDSDEEVEDGQDAMELRTLLMACFKALGGKEWRMNKGWDTPYDIWLWEGLTFNKDFQLVEFRLPNNNLTGKIPDEITQFKHLRVIDLSHNYIEGEMALSAFPRSMVLTHCCTGSGNYESAITGEEFAIPRDIGNMPSLEELCLQNNYLKGAKFCWLFDILDLFLTVLFTFAGELPESIGRCKKLALLRLESNKIGGKIPAQIGNCSELRVLFMLDNRLIGPLPDGLSMCRKLEYLWLNENQLVGKIPERYGTLSNLDTFNVKDNHLKGGLLNAPLCNLLGPSPSHPFANHPANHSRHEDSRDIYEAEDRRPHQDIHIAAAQHLREGSGGRLPRFFGAGNHATVPRRANPRHITRRGTVAWRGTVAAWYRCSIT
jgi:hypothetical protein